MYYITYIVLVVRFENRLIACRPVLFFNIAMFSLESAGRNSAEMQEPHLCSSIGLRKAGVTHSSIWVC